MDAFNLPSTSGALVIDTDYSQQGGATAAAGAGGAAATGDSSLSALSPTPLTPSAGSSMWGAPASSAGKFIVEMDEGGWMHTYHATVYEAPNGQRVQFRTSGALASPFSPPLWLGPHSLRLLSSRPRPRFSPPPPRPRAHSRDGPATKCPENSLLVRPLTGVLFCAAVNTASTLTTMRAVDEQQQSSMNSSGAF